MFNCVNLNYKTVLQLLLIYSGKIKNGKTSKYLLEQWSWQKCNKMLEKFLNVSCNFRVAFPQTGNFNVVQGVQIIQEVENDRKFYN